MKIRIATPCRSERMFEGTDMGGRQMKIRIATEWLSGCAGCHVAVVDLHEKLLALIEAAEFVRIPVLKDEKGYPEADVGIVEGAVRSEHDRASLKKLREKVKVLIAFGTCAVYGGPSGIGWLHRPECVMDRVYRQGPTNSGPPARVRHGPGLPARPHKHGHRVSG